MQVTGIRIKITVLATIIAMFFIVLTAILPSFATMLLSLEIIILPSIYIIGNAYAESLIEEEYKNKIHLMMEKMKKLNEKYYKQKLLAEKKANTL